MTVTTLRKPAAPTLFASVRGSRDLSLAAFAVALLGAFALHAGAFVPRLEAPPAQAAVRSVAAPAAVAAGAPCPAEAPRS